MQYCRSSPNKSSLPSLQQDQLKAKSGNQSITQTKRQVPGRMR